MEKVIKVYTDGASRGNPGSAAIGIVIQDESGKDIQLYKKFIGEFSNNVAEYTALVESVRLLKNLSIQFDEINFYCDSELVVKQIKGIYKIKHKDMIKLSLDFWKEINSLKKKFSISHISREENKSADRLANEALDESRIDPVDRSLLLSKR